MNQWYQTTIIQYHLSFHSASIETQGNIKILNSGGHCFLLLAVLSSGWKGRSILGVGSGVEFINSTPSFAPPTFLLSRLHRNPTLYPINPRRKSLGGDRVLLKDTILSPPNHNLESDFLAQGGLLTFALELSDMQDGPVDEAHSEDGSQND